MLDINSPGFLTMDLGIFSLSMIFFLRRRSSNDTHIFLVDAEVPITYDGQFVRRNGKDYYQIKNIKAHSNVSRMTLKAKFNNVPGWINDAVNHQLNENWKTLKAELDDSLNEYIGNIIRSILQPILNQVAVKDFYLNWTNIWIWSPLPAIIKITYLINKYR